LHALAPRAVHYFSYVIVPVVANGALVANFAMDGILLDQRKSGYHARLPARHAVAAVKSALINLSSAVFARPVG